MRKIREIIKINQIIAAIMTVILIGAATQVPVIALSTESADAEIAQYKMEPSFYSKIQQMLAAGETRDYKIMIFVNPDFNEVPTDMDDTKKNKNKLEKELLNLHKAKDVYKAQILSFVAAEVPVKEIFKLAQYDYVSLIGDREVQGYLLGDYSERLVDMQLGSTAQVNKQNLIEPYLNVLRPSIQADGTRYTGNGIKVAVIDTGIKQDHPDLPVGTKIVNQADYRSGSSCIEYTGQNSAVADSSNHGTHVAGIIAAQGSTNPYRGVAYNAQLINAKIGTNIGQLGIALDWALTKGAKVANVSVATNCASSGLDTFARVADEAIDKGLIVVAPVGPAGATQVASPGCGFNVITVGGTNDQGTSSRTDDTLYSDSKAGPTGDSRTKPDVVAPAQDIYSQSGTSGINYENVSGTSYSSAAVAGAVAQILEKNPSWTPAQVKAAIKQKAYLNSNLSTLTENQRGKGIVDVASTLTLTSSTIDYTLAYGLNVATYIVRNSGGNSVEYKFVKETAGTNIGSITVQDGKLKGVITFKKMAFPGIKIAGVSQTLTDSKLYAGPRVDFTGGNIAYSYVKYIIGSDKVQLQWLVNAGAGTGSGAIQPYARFESSTSKSFEATQYLDFDIGSTNTNDKTTLSASPYTVYNYEQKFTAGTSFNVRDNSPLVTPWLNFNYGGDTTITEWILKWKSTESPTDNPDSYFSSTESINASGSGDNIVVYYKGSRTATSHFSGPTINVNWTTPP